MVGADGTVIIDVRICVGETFMVEYEFPGGQKLEPREYQLRKDDDGGFYFVHSKSKSVLYRATIY